MSLSSCDLEGSVRHGRSPRASVCGKPRVKARVIFCVIPRHVLRFLRHHPRHSPLAFRPAIEPLMESDVNAGSGSNPPPAERGKLHERGTEERDRTVAAREDQGAPGAVLGAVRRGIEIVQSGPFVSAGCMATAGLSEGDLSQRARDRATALAVDVDLRLRARASFGGSWPPRRQDRFAIHVCLRSEQRYSGGIGTEPLS
jgi:hypothetical protein